MIAALKILGPKTLLRLILDEVKQTSEAGSASYIYDIAMALVGAPDVTNLPPVPPQTLLNDTSQQASSAQTRVSLRQMLRWEAEDCKKIQKTDHIMAEHVVRLYRKVEAQLHVVIPQAPALMQNDLGLGMDDTAATSLDNALAAAQGDVMVSDDTGMDLDLGPDPTDMGLDMGGADGGLGLGDDDIFGSLGPVGGGADLLDAWDDML
jgi:mediator of RNA polymerase II transcription subunit 5